MHQLQATLHPSFLQIFRSQLHDFLCVVSPANIIQQTEFFFHLIFYQGLLVKVIMAAVKCQGSCREAAPIFMSSDALENRLVPANCPRIAFVTPKNICFDVSISMCHIVCLHSQTDIEQVQRNMTRHRKNRGGKLSQLSFSHTVWCLQIIIY